MEDLHHHHDAKATAAPTTDEVKNVRPASRQSEQSSGGLLRCFCLTTFYTAGNFFACIFNGRGQNSNMTGEFL